METARPEPNRHGIRTIPRACDPDGAGNVVKRDGLEDDMLLWLNLGLTGLVSLNVLAIGLCRAAARDEGIDRAAFDAAALQHDDRHQSGTAA